MIPDQQVVWAQLPSLPILWHDSGQVVNTCFSINKQYKLVLARGWQRSAVPRTGQVYDCQSGWLPTEQNCFYQVCNHVYISDL